MYKIRKVILTIGLLAWVVVSCNNKKEIFGVYEGTIPCASCPGIDQKLTLNPDHTFALESIYQDRGDGKPFLDKGTFKVENGQVVLSLKEDSPNRYKIGNAFLEQLDMKGNKIESGLNFKLFKK